jgi:hypothetical protein
MIVQPGFLGQVRLVSRPMYHLGQITDPVVLAKVDLAEAFANALTAVSKVAYVKPETMAASPETARMTFENFLKTGNPSFLAYAMKVLVLAAVIVRENIRALGLEPQQLSNILVGAEAAIKKVLPADQLPAELKKYQAEIVSRAPPNIQAQVKTLVEGSGITPENLVPNIPQGATREPVAPTAAASVPEPGLSDLEKVALVGVPLVALAAIGLLVR